MKKYLSLIMAPLFVIFLASSLQAAPISYEFLFVPNLGPMPIGSFTFDDTIGAERFTAFSIDVNPEGLNESYLTLSPGLAGSLFEVLDGPPASFSPFVKFIYPYGENLWFVEGRYEFSIPNRNVVTHEGTFTISISESRAAITQAVDSLGNVQTNSWTDDGTGDWPSGTNLPISLNAEGDSITFTVTAEGEGLEYQFSVQPPCGSFIPTQQWSTDNTWTWYLDESDYGYWVIVMVAIRDDDDEYYWPGVGDDYTYLTYNVTHPFATDPAVFDRVEDSEGNYTEWSIGGDEGTLGWSDGGDELPIVYVGDKIKFETYATNPDEQSGNLQYQFAVQPPGWSFEVKRDWKFNDNWKWKVDESEVGDWVPVMISVKDRDNFDWVGCGDDYVIMAYEVRSPPDEDNDGVYDKFDHCPNTSSGETVDNYGCTIN